MLNVYIKDNRVQLGDRFSVSFHRTLRIPDDGKTYPLPPGLGAFPIHRVEDFFDHVPNLWREHGGIFIPLYQREALWLGFDSAPWKPNAVKVYVGGVNVLSGERFTLELSDKIQDYMVCPPQLWLDGIKVGKEVIRQFVAMPLGEGSSVESQVTGQDKYGGMQLVVFEPLPGKFPEHPPPVSHRELEQKVHRPAFSAGEMGFSAGGNMRQKIYPDPHGLHVWDVGNHGAVFVHLANSAQYFDITGKKPPGTPIDAQTYMEKGLPWFDLYDEEKGDIPADKRLTQLKSIREKEAEHQGGRQGQEPSVDISNSSIHRL